MGKSSGLRRALALSASLLALVALGGCGGGGGGGGGNPAPVPVPAPPPPPPPPPPPVSFTLSGVAPMAGVVYFDLNGNRQVDGNESVPLFTNRVGEFGVGVSGRLQPGGSPPSSAISPILGYGVDTLGGFTYILSAPAGATVVSPITSLIDRGAPEGRVRSLLGLDGTLPVRPTTPLLNFDAAQNLNSSDAAVKQDAARITSANLRLLGIGALLGNAGNGTNGFGQFASVSDGLEGLAALMATSNRGNIQDKAVVLEVLAPTSYGSAALRQDVREAVAELLADYAIAVPLQVSDPDIMARFQLGLQLFVLPEIDLLVRENSAAAAQRVSAMSPASLTQDFLFFDGAPRPPSTGLYFPAPDYFAVAANSLLDLGECTNFAHLRSPICNDISAKPHGYFPGDVTLLSVSVDSANQGRLAVSLLPGNGVRIDPVDSYNGYAYFDYVGRGLSGDQATGRVYVRITPS